MRDFLRNIEEKEMSETKMLVFVCTANMCRSPMAEYLMRVELGGDDEIQICSAGTDAGYGMPATGQAVEAMEELGVDMSMHRSQPLTRELIDAADLVVVMTASHVTRILWRFPDAADKVRLLKSFLTRVGRDDDEISDPIGLSDMVYRGTRDSMREAMPHIVEFLRRKSG